MKSFVIMGLLLTAGLTQAADFCVDSGLAFQQALDTAALNQQANHIQLVQGQFNAVDSGVNNTGFKFHHSSADPLIISGGWLLQNGLCVVPTVPAEPRDTVINGNAFDRAFEVFVGAAPLNFTFTNVYLKFGSSPPPIVGHLTRGAGLKIASTIQAQYAGTVVLDRLYLQDNHGVNSAALYVSGAEHVLVRNSAFFRNRASHYGGLLIEVPSGGRLYFVNNTYRGNQTTNSDLDAAGEAEFWGEAGSQLLVANNIFWGNDGLLDLAFTGSVDADVWLLNNHFNHLDGWLPDVDQNNMYQSIIDINNDYIPFIDSPYINAGFLPDPNQAGQFIHDWSPGSLDFMGQNRINGGGLDISAGEENIVLVFQADFD
ncbi:MAG: hypothetical protein R3E90_13690 [Marinicella sp.]